jgi:hypothetical protein
MGKPFDGYDSRVTLSERFSIGKVYLKKGDNLVKFLVVGKNDSADNYRFGIDCFNLRYVPQ